MFATTIAGNIAYGRKGTTQDEIEAAARLSNAHEFIMSFPDGYKTHVGDKGTQLSGGELFAVNRPEIIKICFVASNLANSYIFQVRSSELLLRVYL